MKNSKLIKNYIYNTLYQVLVLIAPLITTPYISRVLGVTNIGIYQYSQSIANYFVLVGAVGTSLYGQREIAYLQDKPEERTLAFWEIEIFRLVATILCTGIYFFSFCIHGLYSSIYAILTLEVLATAIDISWFFMGLENFKITVIRNTIIKLVGIIGVFLFVKSPDDLGIYTICVTAPIFIGNASLWFSLKKHLIKTSISLNSIFAGIKKRIKPILVLFLPQVATNVYLLLDKTMIGAFGSNIDQVGYYSQAQKIVQVILVLAISLGTVMLPAMSALFAKGDMKGILQNIKNAFRFTYMLCFALLFGLCSITNRFVPVFFGDGYEPVINLIIFISPIIMIISISNIVGKQYLLPTNQQKIYTISILTGAFSNFILNIILIRFFDAIGASIATVFAEIVVTAVQCWYVRKQLPLKECFAVGIRYFLFGAVMFFVVRAVGNVLYIRNSFALVIMIIIGMVVYALELIIFKDPIITMTKTLIKNRSKRC